MCFSLFFTVQFEGERVRGGWGCVDPQCQCPVDYSFGKLTKNIMGLSDTFSKLKSGSKNQAKGKAQASKGSKKNSSPIKNGKAGKKAGAQAQQGKKGKQNLKKKPAPKKQIKEAPKTQEELDMEMDSCKLTSPNSFDCFLFLGQNYSSFHPV